jgi:hypothetical protein
MLVSDDAVQAARDSSRDSSPQPAAAGTTARWFGSARSVDPDARTAGAQATREALAGRQARLVIVFCPAEIDLHAALDGVWSQAGGAPLIGCSGIAHLAPNGPTQPSVVVSALGGDGFEVATSVALDVSAGQRAAGERVAEAVDSLTREHKLLLLLADGLAGEQHELVRGAYGVVGATVPLAGGCAADNYHYEKTFQFYGDADGFRVLSDAVVGAAIGSDAPIGVGVAHGWRKLGEPMIATKSAGGRLDTLDGEPALDVYASRVGVPATMAEDEQAFRLFALRRPLGLSRRSGEDIRVLHGGDVRTGALQCLADVPQGALLWMMETDRDGLLRSVDDAYAEAVAPLDGVPPVGLLAFDCGVRYLFLEPDGVAEEVDRLVNKAAGVPFAGFYTMGEIARSRGALGMHHLTLVFVAFA